MENRTLVPARKGVKAVSVGLCGAGKHQVWYRRVWFVEAVMVWLGKASRGLVRYGKVWRSRKGVAWFGLARRGGLG